MLKMRGPVDTKVVLDPAENGGERPYLLRVSLQVALATVLIVAVVVSFPNGEKLPDTPSTTLASEIAPAPVLNVEPGDQRATPSTGQTEVEETPEPVPVLDPEPFFVSPGNGNDDNEGRTQDAPWRSLAFALRQIQPGQTIYLMDGEYAESEDNGFHYIARKSGTSEDWIRIAAAPGHTPVLVATDGTALEIRANYVEVDGLVVEGRGFSESNAWGVGLSVRGSHHVRFVNNRVSDMPVSGISGIESSNLVIGWNEVYDNSFWSNVQGSGISIWHSVDWGQGPDEDGYHDEIIGNVIYRNENKVKSKWSDFKTISDGNGIIIDQNVQTNYIGRTLITNNVIFDNGGRAVHVFEANHVDVIHNTTFNNGRTPNLDSNPTELSASRAGDVRFINNLAWARSSLPPLVINNSSDVSSEGNLLIGETQSSAASGRDRSSSTAPDLIQPSTDSNGADFRPRFGTARLGQPVDVRPRITVDADGNPRPANGADVGAYQGQDEGNSEPDRSPEG